MLRRVMFLKPRDGVTEQQMDGLFHACMETPRHIPGVVGMQGGKNLIARVPEDAYMVDTLYRDAQAYETYRTHPYHDEVLKPLFNRADPRSVVQSYDAVFYEPLREEFPEPGMKDLLRRSLIVRIEPGTPPEQTLQWEKHIMEMPRHIPAIRNWAFARVMQTPRPSPWTHAWEMEIKDADAFRQYLDSPFHWGVVDRWFDPEWPMRIVAPRILHGYYKTPATVLGWK